MEIDPVDVFHHHEVKLAVGGRIEVNHAGDVGVAQPGGSLRLAFEALEIRAVLHPLGGEHLDCHVAAERRVSCQVDASHAPCPEQFPQRVLAERESLRLAFSELAQLPAGDEILREQRVDEGLRHRPGLVKISRDDRVDLLGRHQATGPERLEEVGRGLGDVAHSTNRGWIPESLFSIVLYA
jgi:hypothetical protein